MRSDPNPPEDEPFVYDDHATIMDEIANERARQVEQEGWTPEHDDQHADGELADAASVYAMSDRGRAIYQSELLGPRHWPARWWPFSHRWWKPRDRRRSLIKAAALLVAEIQRLDRLHDRAARQAIDKR